MHDDVHLTEGRVSRVVKERLWPAVHTVSAPVNVAWHELPGEPIPPAEGLALGYEPVEVGTGWGPAWGTTWFKVTGTVPEEWAGKRVELVCDLGFDVTRTGFQCEGLVYACDGATGEPVPVKSLNPRNQWVLVAEEAKGGEEVELFVEAAANPLLLEHHPFQPTQQGDLRTSSPQRLYTTRRVELAVFEPEVFELCLDLETLHELQFELPEGPRKSRILQALDDALDRVDLQRVPETAAEARTALVDVLAAGAHDSAHRIAAIGHAHIDSAWLWPVRETIRKVARTASSMTELLDEDPEFRYGMSSAQQYAWIKEHRPEVYARVKEAVAEGRFVPLGGMWVESDTTMPSGESLVRQFLYGQRFFEAEFGIRCKGVWLPDSFGYSPALPQLMRRAGFEWFFTQKISWNQVNRFPHHTFEWEGIDGSRILSHFPPMDTYSSQLSGAELAKASRQFRENRVATGSIAPVGWGDGGGGTTREMAGKARRLADLEGSAQVAWTHPDDFFAETRAELTEPPVWVGELYLELHRATLTSQHLTKQGNRRCEHLLVEAELWSATAAVRGLLDYPYDELDELWQQVLLQQFHDILPGTSIAWVHREAAAQYARVAEAATAIIERALAALAGSGSVALIADGRAGSVLAAEPAPAVSVVEQDGTYVLGNGVVEVTVSAEGLITSAVDLATGREAIPAGAEANLLQLHQDFPNMWDAWDVDRFYRNRTTDLREVTSIQITTDGLVIERSISADSSTTQVLSLAPGSRVLDIAQTTDWHETEKFLKVAFPLDIRAEQTLAETQFGYHRRPTHTNTSWEAAKFETSMHRWVLAEEPGFGVALVNDSSYGFDVTRPTALTTELRLSLLRAPRFPDPETDQGMQTHRYGLVIGASAETATEAGAALNTPARSLAGARAVEPLVTVAGEGLVLSSVKLAADRSGDLVVRVYDSLGARTQGELRVSEPFERVEEVSLLEDPIGEVSAGEEGAVALTLGAFEVRTLRFRRG
ncbi:alpha-mannosidase [Nocardioides luteus]|uniref:Alpha-mannosidase n=1 Tax=Nocardioides luteus TaxID=1844 RepID=A0ABQ5STP5_9ACTN|nr:glycoside hydrolase family 38 C-terminal domain-containing protein [Nocardioides luteus]MDR7311410.1 alpha-mannosidase [Nocardioides luteus]GGR65717.1 alpha-mannosidase [Nocardioides luteus]GLJ66914.1 alpha-mannosidase [Nocardioides luteus]